MKLLVDTCVWSLALRRKNASSLSPEEQRLKAQLVQAIQDGRIAMLCFLRQQLLSGIKETAQFDRVQAALDPYVDEPVNTTDHEYAARVYNACRNQGIEPGTVDILICAVAVLRGWEVLSSDVVLSRCLAVTKEFHERQRRTVPTKEVTTRRRSRP